VLPLSRRERFAETMMENESTDPLWLKRLIAEHLRRTKFFWRLYPGLLGKRILRLARLSPMKRLACLPAVTAGFFVDLLASFMAFRALKSGCTDYWPRAQRLGLTTTRAHLDTGTGSLSPPARGEGWGEGNLARKRVTSSPRPSPPFGEEREKTVAVPGCVLPTPKTFAGSGKPPSCQYQQ
jgi:hypothetical protein